MHGARVMHSVQVYLFTFTDIQLQLKSLNTPADLLSQLCQSISLILRLYACSASSMQNTEQ